jgi:competence protein ComEA
LFWNNSESKKENNFTKKKVDYKQELYDFSDNELESISTKININNASVKELETLSGIGSKTAEKIVIYRKKNGNFRSVNDLIKVSGIGEKKLKKIKKYIFIE